MSEKYGLFNYSASAGNEYGQEEMAAMFHHGFLDGVSYKEYGPDSLLVTAVSFGSVSVAPGVMRAQGFYYENTETLNIPIPAFTIGQRRSDRIVVRFDTTADVFSAHSVAKVGTDGSDTPPALTRAGNIYEMSLCQIQYDGASSILITKDEREDKEVCGAFRAERAERAHDADNAGNAENAVRLRTPRLIGNAPFDGTEDISLADIGVPPYGDPPGDVTGLDVSIGVIGQREAPLVYWKDPADEDWVESRLIRKLAVALQLPPQGVDDGVTLVRSTVRDQYSEMSLPGRSPFVDTTAIPGLEYYYQVFTISKTGAINTNSVNRVKEAIPASIGKRMWAGTVTVTPTTANVPAYAEVTFTGAMFSEPPIVCATASSQVIGTNLLGVSVYNVTNTGCRVYITRTNIIATPINVIAMEAGGAGL